MGPVYGQFDASLMPSADWRECVLESLQGRALRRWAPDHIDRDDDALVDIFFAGARQPRHHLRIGYSSIPVERIEAGVRVIGREIATMRRAAG